jgi:ArsR family transcriptional regulator
MDLERLKALADDRRLGIVHLLSDGERCVCELSAELGLSEALVSHHVKRLREAGLVKARRKGQWLHCWLDQEAFDELASELRALAREVPVGKSDPRAACSEAAGSRAVSVGDGAKS